MSNLCECQATDIANSGKSNPVVQIGKTSSLGNTWAPHGCDPRETSETYKGELFRLGRYRVAVCRDGLQWLYQRRRPAISAGGAGWNTLGYCTSKTSLIRLHRAYSGTEAQVIRDLPFHFKRRNQND